jgi:hypothetical protein
MSADEKITRYRLLDIDDIFILAQLGKGVPQVDISRMLCIGSPAICHRLRKYKQLFDGFEFSKRGKKVVASDSALQLFEIADQALNVIMSMLTKNKE